VFVGITQDQRTLVLVKRQILKEARNALDAAQDVGDDVLIADVEGTLDKLEKTLDLLIPSQVEELYLTDEERRGTN
jgi:acetolactate synthase small subunit